MARSRRGSFLQGEDRQRIVVTAIFAAIIAVLVIFLVGAVALAYYEANIRPVARVGAVEIGPGLVRERAALLRNRIEREEARLTPAQMNNEIDAETAAQLREQLNTQRGEIDVVAIEGLIDLIYQSQLAAEMGIAVGDADVEQRLTQETSGVERRRVLAIFVEPETEEEGAEPSLRDVRLARERAEQALAEIEAGREWAEVAREFSTDPSRDAGGDYGVVTDLAAVDTAWSDELFRLPEGGTTPVVAGGDNIFRIGRVVEIIEAGPEPGALEAVLKGLSESTYRLFLRYELAAERLRQQVEAEALAGTPEQVFLAHISIEGTEGSEVDDEGEVHYSEIVYAPGDDIESAPDLDAEDPAWEVARVEAQAAFDELSEITDRDALAERFAATAREESDSPSAEEDGDQGFFARDLMPDPIAEVLFDEELEEGELVGPVRSDAGYVVLLFQERRGSPAARLAALTSALAEPDADFAELARELSDSESDSEEGGELRWFTREELAGIDETLAEAAFDLQPGEVSEPLTLGEGTEILTVLDRAERPFDATQVRGIRLGDGLASGAFEDWYAPRKDEAVENGVIVGAGGDEGDEPGFDDEDFIE
jgi:parvulin-like peptidyl-prolyl isomerase